MIAEPQRPLLRYHGGKWILAPWIISHFPRHRIYVEPFGGAASVLLRKPRTYAEIYNDLDGEIVNLFRVIREQGEELKRSVELTPFSRTEYLSAYQPSSEPLEMARRTIVKSFMGFGSAAITARGFTEGTEVFKAPTGFRSNSKRSGTTPAHHWRNYPENIGTFIDRLRGVCIENKDARDVMSTHDSAETLHYVDPPYVAETRDAGSDYRHEMTDADHRDLATTLHALRGNVCLSGYPCALYDEIYADWRRVERNAKADGAQDRVEVLWMNYQREDDLFL